MLAFANESPPQRSEALTSAASCGISSSTLTCPPPERVRSVAVGTTSAVWRAASRQHSVAQTTPRCVPPSLDLMIFRRVG
jgi:hypothetical protein